MHMDDLISYTNCDPDVCPLADRCPIGPTPNQQCAIKNDFSSSLSDRIAETFTRIEKHPEVSIRLDFLLRPLFEQLLSLRMAELSDPSVMKGRFVNPVLKEIRQTILAIDKVLTEAVRAYYGIVKGKKPSDALDSTSKGYYEMLLTDGASSVETSIGPS